LIEKEVKKSKPLEVIEDDSLTKLASKTKSIIMNIDILIRTSFT